MPPVVDGHVTAEFDGGQGRIRAPQNFGGFYWTIDCKYVRSINTEFEWHQGKLAPTNTTLGQPNFFRIKVGINPSGTSQDGPKPPWQFDPALQHKKYPLEFHPRTGWSAPDNPKPGPRNYPAWSVRETVDPQTGLPFLTGCQILPADPDKPETVVDGDFPATYPDAKCVGGFFVRKGRADVFVTVAIPARGVPHIDRIYRALYELITPLIQE